MEKNPFLWEIYNIHGNIIPPKKMKKYYPESLKGWQIEGWYKDLSNPVTF